MREISNVADAALNAIANAHTQLQDLSLSEEELIMWQNKVIDAAGIFKPENSQSTIEKENLELKQEIQNLKARLEEFSKIDEVEKLQKQ